MKLRTHLVAIAALAAMPLAALAQSNMPQQNDSLSRAQVKSDQRNVEQAGYNNSVGDQTSYPREAQAAEARVGSQQVRQTENGDYGGVATDTSSSGISRSSPSRAHNGDASGAKSVYFGQ
ncbi:hypothetical protein P3T18_000945 [Paraburkholderia sp. GAS199]|uniref:DUF4148 domain-containing protein n=1 Tax=Paraburkholderia sp. GAS199 TaxID=3035126 RepID=UPI003D244DEF